LGALIDEKQARGGSSTDAMGLLLAARDANGEGLGADEVLALAVELFIAGSATTAMTLLWALFLLDQHPHVLAGVTQQLDDVLGDRDPTPADLPALDRLDRVLRESMRVLSTAGALFMRRVAQPTALGGIPLPVGANVVTSPLVMHHDPTIYPAPERFDPERWTTLSPPAYSYLPFGAGPRTCLGALFANQALRLVLAMVLKQFRLRTVEGTRIDRLVRGNILHPRHGLPMTVERRASGREPGPARVHGDIHQLVTLPSAQLH
jgi:cytochrome P450